MSWRRQTLLLDNVSHDIALFPTISHYLTISGSCCSQQIKQKFLLSTSTTNSNKIIHDVMTYQSIWVWSSRGRQVVATWLPCCLSSCHVYRINVITYGRACLSQLSRGYTYRLWSPQRRSKVQPAVAPFSKYRTSLVASLVLSLVLSENKRPKRSWGSFMAIN